ncbi:TonB-dependent receptor [Novosphingobium sp. PhB165]|uniref:TonB-dependent receptor n=1 Tax=Novosphingobium sp. PhB165 TaxID=2485105 RepID=UPI0014044499|nr:TonB-dependent receptor [Novosphingobium sp. PhB165]
MYRALALASVSLLASATSAMAEEQAASNETISTDEIIVTARRREERLLDVPKALNVVSPEQLSRNNITRFEDVQQIVPGLNLQNSNNGMVQNTTLRGVAFDVNSGVNATVEFYLNDAGIQQNYIYQSMYDLGQIEVLRGPQGTLRGRASPSGSITVSTKLPDLDDFGGFVNGSLGSKFYGKNAQGAVNIPVVEGVFALRFAGSIDDNKLDGVRSAYPDIFPDGPYRRSWSERVSARFQPTDTLEFNVVYQHLLSHQLSYMQTQSTCLFDPTVSCDDPGNGTSYVGLVSATDRLSTVNGIRRIRQTMDIINGRADWHVLGQKLSYVGQYAVAHLRPATPQDFGGYYTSSAASGLTYDGVTASRNEYQTHEVRLSSEQRIAKIFDYVVGYFRLDTPTDNAITNAPQIIPAATFPYVQPILPLLGIDAATDCTLFAPFYSCSSGSKTLQHGNRTESAWFGNLTAHPLDKLEISGGARYLIDKNFSYFPSSAMLPVDDRRDSAWIWTGSASYHFTPDFMAYVNAGSSFRQGTQSIGPIAAALVSGSTVPDDVYNKFVSIKPETSQSYEGGIKVQFWNRRAGFNLNYYHQNFQNFLYSVPISVWFVLDNGLVRTTSGFLANVPVKVDGLEADGYVRVSPEFTADFSLSYAHGRIKNGVVPCNEGLPSTPTAAQIQASGGNIVTCRTSGPSSFLPPFTITASGTYTHDFSSTVTGYLRAQGTFNSHSLYNDQSPFDYQNSYAILNAFVGVRSPDSSWDVSLFVKNLTNTKTILSTYGGNVPATTTLPSLAGGASYSSAYSYTSITMPRQIGVTLRYAFGSR